MYGTIAEFMNFVRSQELVQQSNWEPDEVFVNQDFAVSHLEFASTKIDGYIGKLYTVPVIPSPPQLIYICFRLARWSMEQIGEPRPTVQLQHDQAIEELKCLADGKSILVGADGAVVPTLPTDAGPEVDERINMPLFSGARKATVPQFGYPSRRSMP